MRVPLLLLAVHLASAEEPCSCERVAALDDRVSNLEAQLAALRDLLPRRQESPKDDVQQSMGIILDANTATEAATEQRGRRLSAPPTLVSVPSRHIHEFPAGHSCPTAVAGYMQSLPLKATGGVSWEASPSDVTDEISLVSVNKRWATTEIASHPVPLKLVHDSACNTPPSLDIGLNTSINGRLTVNGRDVSVPTFSSSYFSRSDSETVASNSGGTVDDHLLFPGMSHSVTVADGPRTALVYYSVAFEQNNAASTDASHYLVTSLWIDGTERPVGSCAAGSWVTVFYGTCQGIWFGTLETGVHDIQVRYRAGQAMVYGNKEYKTKHIQVLLL